MVPASGTRAGRLAPAAITARAEPPSSQFGKLRYLSLTESNTALKGTGARTVCALAFSRRQNPCDGYPRGEIDLPYRPLRTSLSAKSVSERFINNSLHTFNKLNSVDLTQQRYFTRLMRHCNLHRRHFHEAS